MSIQIRNGNFDLLHSGTIMLDANAPTWITISERNETLTFIFRFIPQPSIHNTPSIASIEINATTLETTFINFDNPLGVYSKDLWLISTFQNRNLYFAYYINSIQGSALKKFHFTFYLGEGVANG